MVLPIDRQKRIRELIRREKSIKISTLSKELDVSEMTVHRDLKTLINEGIVTKTFGGIMLADQASINKDSNLCVLCSRKINDRMQFHLIRTNNEIENVCCPHCGLLRYGQLCDEEVQVICSDFFHQTTISAKLAWYVIDTSIQIGCCQPQLLAFGQRNHAEKFVKGFDGSVLMFTEAVQYVQQRMKHEQRDNCCHH